MPKPTTPAARAAPATALLLAVLLAVNGVAVWGILSARSSAEREAVRDLGLTTAAQARALEAALASLAGAVIFLSQTPALVDAPAAMASQDPMVSRWGRVGAEGTLLLFLESNDEVERAVARAGGNVLVAVGRRDGAPIVLSPEAVADGPPADGDGAAGRPIAGRLIDGHWPLGPREAPVGELVVWIAPRRLLAGAVPGHGDDLRVEPLPAGPAAAPSEPAAAPLGEGDGGGFVVRETGEGRLRLSSPVVGGAWSPPLHWELTRTVDRGSLVGSFDRLAGRYRTTLLVNLGVVSLTLVLALLAFREVRRSARLAAENAQQARVRELERQVLHAERLAGVGRLAAGMAHEINNPLEGMTNYLGLLRDDLERGDLEGARALAGRVREGLDRVAGITRQVLDYSQPGKAPKRRVDLRGAVADAADFVRESGAFPGVRLTVDGTAEELPVRANPTTLGQLFLNLVLNACEAQQGGAVEVTVYRHGKRARVRVADHGPGIPEDDLPHLFEPFFSTRGSTGLGLAVCHGVVSEHGGTLEAANRPGGGAVFTVELPLLDDDGDDDGDDHGREEPS